MSPHPSDGYESSTRSRFVTVCQQLFALAVVIAVLTPAARTISMDVRPSTPSDLAPGEFVLRGAEFPSKVPNGPVDVDVDEYALTEPASARGNPGDPVGKGSGTADLDATIDQDAQGRIEIVSDPAPVEGYGTVGVTWGNGTKVADGDMVLQVRSQDGGRWSRWTKLEYHDEHSPDPNTAEGRRSRPGTEPILVGDVDQVQVKVAVDRTASEPEDMQLAVIDPGTAKSSTVQKPAIDTADPKLSGDVSPSEGNDDATLDSSEGDLALQATKYTPKPKIYSRAQWGANESIRDKGSLHYGKINGGFVHHTVNANNYTRDEVPGIIRGIYAYHVKTRGWSDVGYNFLVDRFGRIWEGRAGGVDRPVVGAHTLGYNDYSFAMSAIGNFETAKPTTAMINAYGSLFAWKLSLHGVDAGSTSVKIGDRKFAAISGHRDAGSTACPGRYLYARIPDIRRLANDAQVSFSERNIESNYAGGPAPDLVVRRKSDGKMFTYVLQKVSSSHWKVSKKIATGVVSKSASHVLRAGDWDRDGHADVITRNGNNKSLYLMRGRGDGTFVKPRLLSNRFKYTSKIAAPGDVTGDGWPDLIGQVRSGSMTIFPGRGLGGSDEHHFYKGYRAYPKVSGSAQIAAGLYTADGAPDTIVRDGSRLKFYYGNGPGNLTGGRQLDASAAGLDWIIGIGRADGTDRFSDYVVRDRDSGRVSLVNGSSTGWKSNRISLGTFSGIDIAG